MKHLKVITPLKPKNVHLLQKSKNAFTFPRSSRFPPPKENDDPSLLILPSTLSKKTCTFGLGNRSEIKSRHCQDSPCPTRYTLQGCFGKDNHIIDYKRQTVKERELFYIKPVPGPGSYNPGTPKRKHSPSCFIIGRKHIRSHSMTPSPGEYNPDYSLKYSGSHRNLSFSRAKRQDLYRLDNESPGPGMYHVEQQITRSMQCSPNISRKTSLTHMRKKSSLV